MKHEIKMTGTHPQWCGPTAVAMITGRTINYVARLYADVQNTSYTRRLKRAKTSRQVSGVYPEETIVVLNKLGYVVENLTRKYRGLTLNKYMAQQNTREMKGKVLINVTRHYVVAHMNLISDNHELARPVGAHMAYRKKIVEIYLVTRKKK